MLRAAVNFGVLAVAPGTPPRFERTESSRLLMDSHPKTIWPMARPVHPDIIYHMLDSNSYMLASRMQMGCFRVLLHACLAHESREYENNININACHAVAG